MLRDLRMSSLKADGIVISVGSVKRESESGFWSLPRIEEVGRKPRAWAWKGEPHWQRLSNLVKAKGVRQEVSSFATQNEAR